jgi:hypothetical protein
MNIAILIIQSQYKVISTHHPEKGGAREGWSKRGVEQERWRDLIV